MELSKEQVGILSSYLSDISKILFASTVLGFFVPSASGPVPLITFMGGFILAVLCLFISIGITR